MLASSPTSTSATPGKTSHLPGLPGLNCYTLFTSFDLHESPWISIYLCYRVSRGASMSYQFHNASSFGSHNSWLDRQVLHGWDLFLGPKHPWSNCRKQILTNAWLWMIFIQLETWETSTEESWAPVYVDAFQILTYSTYLTCGPCPKAVHSQGLMMWLSSLTIGEKPL